MYLTGEVIPPGGITDGPPDQYTGCAFGHPVRTLDLTGPPYTGSTSVVIAGDVVAFGSGGSQSVTAPDYEYVIVWNLLTGHNQRLPPCTQGPIAGSVGGGQATDVVVRADGAVAWICKSDTMSSSPTAAPYYEVHAVDRTGSRVLATGTAIDPSSLALAGDRIYWTANSQPFSASLT